MSAPKEKAKGAAKDTANVAPAAAEPTSAAPSGEAQPKPDYYEQLLRLKADFENYRKRVDRERPEWVRLGRAALMDKLLPLYDVLLQAHEQVAKGVAGPSQGPSAQADIAKGLELIFKEFTKVFESEGVQVIETVGKPYHYDLHEALGSVETDEQPEGVIVDELQRGYTLNGKVLRPARVRIAKATKKKEDNA